MLIIAGFNINVENCQILHCKVQIQYEAEKTALLPVYEAKLLIIAFNVIVVQSATKLQAFKVWPSLVSNLGSPNDQNNTFIQ